MEDLAGRIDGVLDGGPAGVGLESTVVRVLNDEIHVLRPGGVTEEELREAAGPSIRIRTASEHEQAISEGMAASAVEGPRSPGMKYTHYAPQGVMLLVSGDDPQRLIEAVREQAASARKSGRRVGIIACAEHAERYGGAADEVLVCGSRQAPETAAQQLYSVLRECDRRNLAYIVAEGFPETGIGAALMNRMRKAAGGRELVV
jgi:L-threonylcarbamoyladenylate synthase